jgi:hypothetical protein
MTKRFADLELSLYPFRSPEQRIRGSGVHSRTCGLTPPSATSTTNGHKQRGKWFRGSSERWHW